MSTKTTSNLKIGLALGSGSSRGWAHIGIINALAEQGIRPDIVCGTSVGALVGAAHAAGNLDKLEEWVRSLTRLETASFFELTSSFTGFVNTSRLRKFLEKHVAGANDRIEDLKLQYGSVATDLESGREIWFTKGPLLEAVWASISLPGLFPAIRHENRWLVDGGLVNPVPVSVCRALGADVVIAVNLNGDIVGKHLVKTPKQKKKNGVAEAFSNLVKEYAGSLFFDSEEEDEPPGLFDAIAGSVNIAQERITRSRLAGDPPEILLAPKLSHIGLLEFFRAEEAIAEGSKCVERALPEIEHLLQRL
ncbi:patatin-like phospholipase family protein [Desulfomicrobium baculatum]|uniref:Patatin n=1 Tax=Desulfomicrobium baculatum (strain DSM 4028 / VKM B-1378 / X) TaxID=525897 RepID=C7LWU3_DESBD|nr:patatin-like phospholipase family protein [Desulfomicrobium baculatum]ACU91153.1 Patatin [Desulfomicrobium baculatum DSM 4028]